MDPLKAIFAFVAGAIISLIAFAIIGVSKDSNGVQEINKGDFIYTVEIFDTKNMPQMDVVFHIPTKTCFVAVHKGYKQVESKFCESIFNRQ